MPVTLWHNGDAVRKLFLYIMMAYGILNTCRAQDTRFYLDANIGPAFAANGFADHGAATEVGIVCNFSKYAGYGAMVRWQFNKMSAQSINNGLKQSSLPVAWDVHAKNWESESFMIGSDNTFPFSPKTGRWSLRVRMMLGATVTLFPGVDAHAQSDQETYHYVQNSISALSMSCLFGAGIQWKVGKKLYLTLDGSYFGTNPTFKNVQTFVSSGTRDLIASYTTNFSEDIRSLTAGVGIRLAL